MEDIIEIAKYFLTKESLTPKKLQKLTYYAYAWFITLMNEDINDIQNRLFENRPEAWVHGPVFRDLYDKYKEYGYSKIEQNIESINFDEDVIDVLEQVWKVYGSFNANELESLTHQESPWINARKGCSKYEISSKKISDRDIFECYVSRLQ